MRPGLRRWRRLIPTGPWLAAGARQEMHYVEGDLQKYPRVR